MCASSFELASNAAKEIVITLIDKPNIMPYLNPDELTGVELFSHFGDCYQALYRKALEVIK